MKVYRWQQRFEYFTKAYNVLDRAAQILEPNEIEKMGIIQSFEVVFELAWKLMGDFLKQEGYQVRTPREIIKQAVQIDMINDGYSWLDALQQHNLVAHTYNEQIVDDTLTEIRNTYLPIMQKLYHFFSTRT